MTTSTRKQTLNGRARRGSLNLDRVVKAAIAIADGEGMPAVTIRNIAARLDVAPMAIYTHARGKQEIENAIVEAVLDQFDPPPPTGDWEQDLANHMRELRRLMLAHPWLAQMLFQRTVYHLSKRPKPLAATEAIINPALTTNQSEARWVVALLNWYCLGAVQWYAPRVGVPKLRDADRVFDLGLRALISGLRSEFGVKRS